MFYLSHSELILHHLITAALFGIIWIVQLILYPSFRYIPREKWVAFHRMHTRSMAWVLIPLMICELGLSAWLAGKNGFRFDYTVPLCLVLAIWISTFLIQFPILNQLAEDKEEGLINRLVNSNWIRTILWSVKLVWVSWQSYINLA